jgi:hypothetical protein
MAKMKIKASSSTDVTCKAANKDGSVHGQRTRLILSKAGPDRAILARFHMYTAKKDSGAFLNLFKELGAFNLLRKEP